MSQCRAPSYDTSLSTHVLACLIIALLGLLLYGHILQAPFYLDDVINLRDKLYAIKSLSLGELFDASLKGSAHPRPLANLSFALNYYFHGHQLPGYHLLNIVIHVASGMLLYLFVFKTITLPGQRNRCDHPVHVAAMASLLWFVNPVQIQAVTYIIQRMTSLAALFFLCSFLSYLYGRLATKKWSRVVFFGSSALCWLFAMGCKEIALTLPGLLLVYEWFFFQNLDTAWLKKSAIYMVAGLTGLLTAVYLVYHYSPLGLLTTISLPREYTALERFLTQGRVIFAYVSLLLFPHPARLTLNHDISISHGLFDPLTTFLSFAGLTALFVLTILMAKRYRLVSFCIIWFLANVAIEALAARIEPMFEHRVYLPSMLFFLPCVWFLFTAVKKPKIVFSVIGILVVVSGIWTYQRNAIWNDPVAFWEDAVRKAPNHYRTHVSLGVSYLDVEQYDHALEAFQKALALDPPYPTKIHTSIGLLYLQTEQHDLARQNLDRAVSLNSNNYLAFDLLGTLCRKQEEYGEALQHYGRAIKVNPNFAPSYYNTGTLLMEMEDLANAVKALEMAVTLRPMWSQAYSSLGLALAKQERYSLAISTLQKAVSLDAKNQEALFNQATAYNLTGQHEVAAQIYKGILEIDPKDVEAMHNLGVLYMKDLKDIPQATFYLKKALATDPDYKQADTVKKTLTQIGVEF